MRIHTQGLTTEEVKQLQLKYGLNELPIKDSKTFIKTLVRIVTEPMFALLLLAAFIYLLIGSPEDAALLTCFIALSIGITVFQERKSEKALEALKDLSSPRALVLREANAERIPGREVVVGDLLILEEGDRVAADATLVDSHDLLVDESLLTGESEPIEKNAEQLVYSGSLVIRGGGTALVNAIGLQTEIGKIGKSLQKITNSESPLQSDIRVLIKRFAILGTSLSVIVCLIYGFFYHDWYEGALSGISLTMSLLPQEFTVILTVFMALGVWRISRQHVLTRYAPVIETLGSISSLCVDKTGTLTVNKMSLQILATLQDVCDLTANTVVLNESQERLLSFAVLASEIKPFDPMERAFHESMKIYYPQHQKNFEKYTIVHEFGLSPELPAMTHIWQSSESPEDCLVAIKGSPEAVMNLCELDDEQISIIEKQVSEFASNGLRILGVAKVSYRHEKNSSWPDSPDKFSFQWLGLVGLKDPLRDEVPKSVKQCQTAGIRVIMITGDHAITAKAIATQAGIDSHRLLSGTDIDRLTDLQLQSAIKDVCVYVRIKPEQKLRIVRALQENQEIVAMTGDGVNDAPALKAAHVGISMGQRGTDVAREASSLVLLNDDFSSIVNAIRQGRQIYDNLQKAIIYVLAVHIPIAGAVFIPLLFGAPAMMSPIHILFLEMIIDPSCAIVFEIEPPEANVMHRPPRGLTQRIFSMDTLSIAVFQGVGLTVIVVVLYLGLLQWDYSRGLATTISFGSLVLGNLLLIIVNRSSHIHIFKILKNPNQAQHWIIGLATSLFLIILFTPFLRERFNFSEVTLGSASLILFSGVLGLLWHEGIKALYRLKSISKV